uniref:Uncharacterized protein n=1 Tax=Raphanus sativus TaxID=3726 RepID=A0A650GBZ5_RAPSA|nr:hypothetical protein [Raphanus sativus]
MLRSKTNQWGHAGTTEYALERSIPPLRHQKKPGRTSNNSPPASIEKYRGNVDLSGHIGSLGTITSTAGLYLNENAVSFSGA